MILRTMQKKYSRTTERNFFKDFFKTVCEYVRISHSHALLTCVGENRYIGYIRYTGICSDTGIGDMYNSKIPIYRTFGISLRDTVCRIKTLFQVKAALSIITFINKKTKFIITERRFGYLNVVFQRRAKAKFRKNQQKW